MEVTWFVLFLRGKTDVSPMSSVIAPRKQQKKFRGQLNVEGGKNRCTYGMRLFRGGSYGGFGSPSTDVALALYCLCLFPPPQELGPRVCVPQGPSLLRMRQVFRKRVTALSVLLVITAGQSNDGDAQLLPALPQRQFPSGGKTCNPGSGISLGSPGPGIHTDADKIQAPGVTADWTLPQGKSFPTQQLSFLWLYVEDCPLSPPTG